jgi:hypothetical protein
VAVLRAEQQQESQAKWLLAHPLRQKVLQLMPALPDELPRPSQLPRAASVVPAADISGSKKRTAEDACLAAASEGSLRDVRPRPDAMASCTTPGQHAAFSRLASGLTATAATAPSPTAALGASGPQQRWGPWHVAQSALPAQSPAASHATPHVAAPAAANSRPLQPQTTPAGTPVRPLAAPAPAGVAAAAAAPSTVKRHRGPREGRGPITRRHKLISERYRELQSRQLQRDGRGHLTAANKGAWEDAASKNSGMQRAVRHLQALLLQQMQPTLQQQLQQNPHLPNKQQLYQQVEQQAEQQALEALDNLQLMLGRAAGQTADGGRLSAGKTASRLRAVYSLWDKNKADEPQASGGPTYDGRKGKIQLPKGAATPVPDVPELTMKQVVTAVMEAGLCPQQPLSWWFGE